MLIPQSMEEFCDFGEATDIKRSEMSFINTIWIHYGLYGM